MLTALHAVHTAGVLHNDVSATSFIVMSDATVRLVGFGAHSLDIKYSSNSRTKSTTTYSSAPPAALSTLSDAMFACPHSNPPVPSWFSASSKVSVQGAKSCWKFEPDYHGVADVSAH